jgi:hypothetical protein
MPKKRLSPKAAVEIIKQLFDYYDLDHSPDRDRSRDGDRFTRALLLAAQDGLVRAPPPKRKRRGRPDIWTGERGLQLVSDVGYLKARYPLTTAAAIELLHNTAKWRDVVDLYDRHLDARRHWGQKDLAERLLYLFHRPVF